MSEYNVEKPKKIAQSISPEEMAAMEPIDKLVQVVVPRLIDKVNELTWENGKLKHDFAELEASLKSRIDALDLSLTKAKADIEAISREDKGESRPVEKKTKTRKAVKDKPTYVPEAQYAVYDSETDTWQPREIDGKKITGALIDTVKHLNGGASEVYSQELIDYINGLDDEIVAAIKDRFPTA
ncbi:MAG: hypothetical protein HDQ88_09370 [Clostridia bacterium]|nr:hypothetical protein [Clostridia bacterium]